MRKASVLAMSLLAALATAGCTHIGADNQAHIDCISHQTNCPDNSGIVWLPANH